MTRALHWTVASVLLVIVVVAFVGPWVAPHDPEQQVLGARLGGPSGDHWLGTDELGRDVASRMIVATRVTLYAGVLAAAVAAVAGLPLGVASGYARGRFDAVVARGVDALMAIPPLLFALAMIAVLGHSVTNAMIAVGIVMSPRFYRVARAAALRVREEAFVEASRSAGATHRFVVGAHLLPNMAPSLLVQASTTMAFAIMFEASLSYLGLGVQAPAASWGSMLQRATQHMEAAPHLVLVPGVAITVVILAFMFAGDALADAATHRSSSR